MDPESHGLSINILLGISNIPGIGCIKFAPNMWVQLFMCNVVVWSTLMHLSDTKHYLPGLPYLNKFSYWFLQMDRLFAALAFFYVLSGLDTYILVCSSGLLLLYMSENIPDKIDVKNHRWLHFISHIAWHGLAYIALAHRVQQ